MRKAPNIFDLAGLFEHSNCCSTQLPSGAWVPARPIGMDSLPSRLRAAWMVFTGRADALVWPGGQ